MGRAKYEKSGILDNRISEKFLARKMLYRMLLSIFVLLGIAIIFLLISNYAQAGDFGVEIQYNSPSNGIANVTPGIDYEYTVDIINTGTNNTGEDINFTVELNVASIAAGWTVTPTGTTIIPNLQMEIANKTTETVTVRAPVDAKFQDTAVINITVEVIGHEGEVGGTDSLQLRANVVQVYGALMTTTQDTKTGDPGENVSFEIKITNQGNGNDTFSFSATGPELGAWSAPDVNLEPDEFVFVYYNFTISPGHIPGDIPITLNVSSTSDVTGLTYDTLDITIQVNPIYEVDIIGVPSSASIKPGESYNFTILVENTGTGDDTIKFYLEGVEKDWAKIYKDTTEQYEIFVEAGHITTMTLVISVPSDELMVSGIIFTVNATSLGSLEVVFDTYDFTVDVDQSYGVYIVCPPSGITSPGQYIEIPMQIHNTGNSLDSFRMSIENPRFGWEYKFDGQDDPIIGPFSGFYTVTLRITPWEEEAPGDYPVTIRATSQGDTSVYVNYTFFLGVNQVYGVELQPSGPTTRDVELEGGSTAFYVKVYNRGNGPDTLSLWISSAQDYWIEMSHTDVSPDVNDFTAITIWVNISSRAEWESKGSPDPIIIDVEVETPGDPSPTQGEGTLDILQLTAIISPIYGLYADVSPSLVQDVEIGDSVTFTFTIHNEGTTGQRYRVTTMSYDSSNFVAPVYNPSQTPFPSSPTTDDVTLQMTVQPTVDGLKGSYDIWVKIFVDEDTDVGYHVNVTVNIKANYGVELSAQNDVTNKETLINTHANYTLIIKNIGNTDDTFYINAIGDYTSLVTFDWQYVTLGPEQSAFVICYVYADKATIEANGLYASGIPSTIRVTSENDTNEFDTITLDTDITVVHDLSLSSPDPEKDVEPGEVADFILIVENTGTTSDKYIASVVAFNTSALDNPNFSPSNPFPSTSVSPGTTTTLSVDVSVISDPLVPVGEYYLIIRISIDGYPSIYKDFNFTIQVEQLYLNKIDLEVVDEDRKDANVNEYVNYTLRITNTGNGQETFLIAATGKYSNLVTLEFTEATLDISESIDFDAQVFTDKDVIDGDDLYGMDLITPIKVTSKNDPDQFSLEVNLYTNINHIYTFSLSTTDDTKEGEPGESVSFTLQVENTGTNQDSYSFVVTGIDESIFEDDPIVDTSPVSVNNIGSSTARITITDEKNKALVGTYEISIMTSSKTETGVNQEITLFIIIEPSAEVEITPSSQTDGGEPGDMIDYTVKIINRGNAQDTFYLTLNGSYKDWGEIYDHSGTVKIDQVTLEAIGLPGYFTDIIVRVTITGAGETKEGEIYVLSISAASTNTEGVKDIAQVSTSIDRYVELLLEYAGSGEPEINYDPNKAETFPARFRFKAINNGNVDETSITVNIDGMPGWNSPSIETIEILEPGQSTTFSITFNIPSGEDEGSYDMEIYLTSTDGTFDSDFVEIIINISKPDLVVSDVQGLEDVDYLRAMIGDPVTITATIENTGKVRAESIQVKLYEDDIAIQTKTISSINAEESKDVTFRWNVPDDEVEVYVMVVPQDEGDDGNNEGTTYPLDLRPNLTFTGNQLIFSKSNPEPGENITITAFIKNNGGNAEDVVVKFYEGVRLIETDTLDISSGEIGEAKLIWDVPDSPGENITIRAVINHTGSKGDGDESTKSIEVAEAEDMDIPVSDKDEGPSDYLWMLLGLIIGIIIGILTAFLGFIIGKKRRDEYTETDEEYQPMGYEMGYGAEAPAAEQIVEEPQAMPPPPPPPPPEMTELETTQEEGIEGEEGEIESDVGEETITKEEGPDLEEKEEGT